MRKIKVFIFNGIVMSISTLIIRGIAMAFGVYVADKVGKEALRHIPVNHVYIYVLYNPVHSWD